ncbi:MAG: hypothetical protein IJ411_02710 [Oscillospiraceae bacterium]|nr:hypothetical protein [Oscillospiraceae bacterium]
MRIFHVSEEANISVFHPRLPTRDDLDPNVGLIWAIDEQRLPNFLTPRNCPRVTYHINEQSRVEDIERFFSGGYRHVVAIEQGWFETMKKTRLYLYEFDPAAFELQDAIAGYYVAKTTQRPIAVHAVHDLFAALFQQKVELRVVDDLWPLADQIQKSSLPFSFCRMTYAQPRK